MGLCFFAIECIGLGSWAIAFIDLFEAVEISVLLGLGDEQLQPVSIFCFIELCKHNYLSIKAIDTRDVRKIIYLNLIWE